MSGHYPFPPCPTLGCAADDLYFIYWDASSTSLLTTVDMALGTTSFGGTPQTLTGVTNHFLKVNTYGYNIVLGRF